MRLVMRDATTLLCMVVSVSAIIKLVQQPVSDIVADVLPV